MSETTFDALFAEAQEHALRKPRQQVLRLMPYTVAPLTTLLGPTGQLLAPPTESFTAGRLVAGNAPTRTSNDSTEEDMEIGSDTPARSDAKGGAKELQVVLFENALRQMDEVIEGMDLSAIKSSTHGEVAYDLPTLRKSIRWKGLLYGFDGDIGGFDLEAEFYYALKVKAWPERAFTADASMKRTITFAIEPDEQGRTVRVFRKFKTVDDATDKGWGAPA